jgi:hypothetical protein
VIAALACQIRVVRNVTRPAFPSTRAIAAEMTRRKTPCSYTTIDRVLRAQGFKPYVRPKAPTLDPKVFAKRLKFCNFWKSKPLAVFRQLVFSDEHYITTNDHSTRTQWVRSSNDTIPISSKNVFNIPSFMIWGAIGVGWRSELVFVKKRGPGCDADEGPRGMNADRYVRVCLCKIVPDLVSRGLIFQHDGARPHMANSTRAYLSRKEVKMVEDWPPYSPDLNPVEHMWKLLDARISESAPDTFTELKAAAIKAWNEFPQQIIDNLVLGFRSKVQRCSKAQGGPLKRK